MTTPADGFLRNADSVIKSGEFIIKAFFIIQFRKSFFQLPELFQIISVIDLIFQKLLTANFSLQMVEEVNLCQMGIGADRKSVV